MSSIILFQLRYLLALKTVIKPNGHKAYVLFSNVVQVIPREQVGIGRRKREVPVDEPDDLCPLHASGRRTHELDDFVGQVMAAIARQLGADSSALRLLNLEQNTVTVELLFQNGRVMSSAEAKYPECWRSLWHTPYLTKREKRGALIRLASLTERCPAERFSLGIDNVHDLQVDLEEALAKI